MWYRFGQLIIEGEKDNGTADREILDMTGGVRSRRKPDVPIPKPIPEPNAVDFQQNEGVAENQEVVEDPEFEINEQESDDTNEENVFTDYTPQSSAEENAISKAQDMYRAEDLNAIISGAGVKYPMHESCSCRIQFRPDDSTNDLLVPRWEVSSGACNDCLAAQQKFNQYVEQSGVRVQPPDNVNV